MSAERPNAIPSASQVTLLADHIDIGIAELRRQHASEDELLQRRLIERPRHGYANTVRNGT